MAIAESLKRIGYKGIEVIRIDCKLNVPKGIAFYSAHFKIDAFRYLASLPDNEYSILLDSDIICMKDFNKEFYAIVEEGLPMVYYLNGYGGIKKLCDVRLIDSSITWMPWAGGEFIGGKSAFYNALYREVMFFVEQYWEHVHDGLFHVGDEMLTSIALQRLRKKGIVPIDAKLFNVIHRYWSVYESDRITNYSVSLLHLPGDKTFFQHADIHARSINKILAGYSCWWMYQRAKQFIKQALRLK